MFQVGGPDTPSVHMLLDKGCLTFCNESATSGVHDSLSDSLVCFGVQESHWAVSHTVFNEKAVAFQAPLDGVKQGLFRF
jgi:hypothetical protein